MAYGLTYASRLVLAATGCLSAQKQKGPSPGTLQRALGWFLSSRNKEHVLDCPGNALRTGRGQAGQCHPVPWVSPVNTKAARGPSGTQSLASLHQEALPRAAMFLSHEIVELMKQDQARVGSFIF